MQDQSYGGHIEILKKVAVLKNIIFVWLLQHKELLPAKFCFVSGKVPSWPGEQKKRLQANRKRAGDTLLYHFWKLAASNPTKSCRVGLANYTVPYPKCPIFLFFNLLHSLTLSLS